MIRRHSDAHRSKKECRYHQQFLVEVAHQNTHLTRQQADPEHDRITDCWCCCDDCIDLAWYHLPRKSIPWAPTPSSIRPPAPETSDGSPGSAETNPS